MLVGWHDHFARVLGLVASAFFLLPGVSLADAKAGETIAKSGVAGVPACMTCHGAAGEGQAAAAYPRLAGQAQPYLLKQLQDFRARRASAVMQPFAQKLSDAQMSDLADYYASLPNPMPVNASASSGAPSAPASAVSTTPSGAGGAPEITRGAHLAQKGNWDKGVPACFACHGENGQGIAPSFPALAGQNAAYITKQLNDWQSGARSNDPQGLMKAVAEKMSRDDITAVAAYLERLH